MNRIHLNIEKVHLHAQHFPSAHISPPNMQSLSLTHFLSQLDPSGQVSLLVLILFLLKSTPTVVLLLEEVGGSLVDDDTEAVEAVAENLVGSEATTEPLTGGPEASAAAESAVSFSKKLKTAR